MVLKSSILNIPPISEDARALHQEAPAIDLHADSLLWAHWFGYDLNRRHQPPLPKAFGGGHVDVSRLQEGGIGAQFFGLVSLPALDAQPAYACLSQIEALQDAIQKSHGQLNLVTRAEELAATPTAALLGIEGAHALQGSLAWLERFAKLGVRYLGLLHFTANECGAPAYGWGANPQQGLTHFGRAVIETCEALGVIVDLSHINPRGFKEACEIAKKPLIVSHTGVSGVHTLWRNIDDDALRAVANHGGVVGVIFCPHFLGRDGMDAVVDHLEHIVNVAGEDTAALGSDWDGFIVPTRGLEEASKLPALTDAMLRRGFSVTRIRKILRENALRVLRDVPPHYAVSGCLQRKS